MRIRPERTRRRALPLIEELEPRVLFSAGLDVVLIDSSLEDADLLLEASTAAEAVVFYDSTRETAAELLGRVRETAEERGEPIESLSILSHGSAGQFQLGTDTISLESLELSADTWAQLAESLAEGGNIYLFGCNVGQGEGGLLLDRLAQLTGHDVFASDDTTGAGGDWTLEAASDGAETELWTRIDLPFDVDVLEQYQGVLANTAPVVNDQGFSVSEDAPIGAVVGTVVATDAEVQGWYSTSWSSRKEITVDSDAFAADETDFPLLVSLGSDAELAASARADGFDILFTAADGTTKLDHEIETFVSATGELQAWVRIPLVSSSADTTIHMYYGNAAATDQQNAPGVWDSDYLAVWHLGEDVVDEGSAVGAHLDSTSGGRDLDQLGNAEAAGQIGTGQYLDGNDALRLSGLLGQPSDITLSGWFNLEGPDAYGSEVISLGDHVQIRLDSPDGTTASIYYGSDWDPIQDPTNYATTGWHHVSFTYDNYTARQRLYIDGIQRATNTFTANIVYSGLGSDTYLGQHGNGGTDTYFTGVLDEFRVSGRARSASWIAAEYANQSGAAGVVSVGPETGTGPLSYAITAGNTGGAFAIDSSTGEITVASVLDHESLASYSLTVEVSDGALSDTAIITIDVDDVNESDPVVVGASFSIPENASNGTSVGTVSASDADTSQTLSYAITGGDPTGIFSIDASTGEITLADASQIDHESTPSYALTVTVTDSGSPSRSGAASISIGVTDVNESAPVVVGASFAIAENASNGTSVGTVSASDADTSQTLSYAITGGDPTGIFSIDASTGEITLADASQIDHESAPSYALTVTVTDSGSPSRSGAASISIEVTDVNEFAPVAPDQTFSVNENAIDGATVGVVLATDADSSQVLSYQIVAGNLGGAFAIDAATGRIFVADATQLDAVGTPQYTLTVQVDDDLSPTQSDTASITIDVSGNSAPIIANQSFAVDENSAASTVVGTVVAGDPDLSGGVWADSAWSYRKQLTIDRTRVYGDLTDFPVLVSFASDADLATNVGDPGGLDLFFALPDGTRLDHEIELFDSGTGQLAAWVRVPYLSASTDTQFYLYYGNAAAPDQQNVAGVWDAGFESVHHLSTLQDSTVNAHDLTALDDAVWNSAISGGIGGAASLDGVGDGFTMGDVDALDGIQQMTISGWVRMNSIGEFTSFVTKTSPSSSTGWATGTGTTAYGVGGGGDDMALAVGQLSGSPNAAWSDSNSLSVGPLRYWTIVYDGTQGGSARFAFYLDGVLQSEGVAPSGPQSSTPVNSASVQFGHHESAGGSPRDHDGDLEEIRISTVTRSSAWVQTDFETQNNPSVFVVASSQERPLSYAITAGNGSGAFAIDSVSGEITVADPSALDHEALNQHVLTVAVSDSGSPALSSSAQITIDVGDVNEFDPVVSSATFGVLENAANGTAVSGVVASDADTSQALSYAITGGDPTGIFAIDSVTGAITVADSAQLDRESAAQHVLTVTVTDDLAPQRSGSGTITVNVQDVNEFDPVVSSAAFGVLENAADGTAVGGVVASDADTSQALSYAITGGDPTGIFAIDPATGAITVADGAQLDHEAAAQYTLTVMATDDLAPQRSGSGTITVNVQDVNEFDPAVSSTTFGVLENAANGTTVGGVAASDADTSQTLSYAITGGDPTGIFAIDSATGVISIADSAQLDHESAAQHVLTVTVTDDLAPQRSSAGTITVNVQDVNEFDPVVSSATFGVLENAANGTAVGGVVASDADTSQSLSYAITGGDPTGIFAIDSATGAITVADGAQLDREAVAQYALTVMATDDLAPQRSGTGTITVNVQDVNEFDPVVADSTFSVLESVATGAGVGSVAASDADTSQVLSYAITGGDPTGIFAIDPSTGVITVADSAQLDYEATTQYLLTVMATDDLAPQRSGTGTITVNVQDANEFDPVVSDATFGVLENAANGTSVGGVVASDADTSQMLSYAITGGDPTGIFAIDAATGAITVADSAQLDHESAAQHVLIVTATDDLAPQRSGAGTITVNVQDVNEFDPVVSDATFAVLENAASGTAVGGVVASDADTSQTLSYAITGGDPTGIFAIDPATGAITVADGAQLDHEGTAQYSLTVMATDDLTPQRSGTGTITVTVQDVNEFDPVVSDATFGVLENAVNGAWVGGVAASDADTSQTLSYAITGGDPTGIFAVDAATGAITVADSAQLDHESAAQHVLIVTATDDLAPQRSGAGTITVNVQDVNEFDPVVSDATFAVLENAANGTAVGGVVASDADTSQTLSYAITGGDSTGIFAIDTVTGAITVADSAQLDHESAAQHVLTVTVTDDLAPQRSGTGTITVNVQDVNEFDPVVSDATFGVFENSVNGTWVGGVVASDADASQALSYAITGGDPAGIFAIDAVTGAITVADSTQLDHESAAQHVLIVTATDDLAPQRSGAGAITVNVQDVNEFDPTVSDATFAVLENAANGTSVGGVVASDPDTSQALSYAITGGDPAGIFAIDAATGAITVADSAQLDHESAAQHVLMVTVTDDLAPQRSGTGTITVNVQDVNEFDPVVSDATFGVFENSVNGTLVGGVVASDADTSQTLSYAITSGDPTGVFAIDTATGVITVADPTQLDHEIAAQRVVVVTVTDDLVPQRSSTGTITVNVQDVNEFDPVVQSSDWLLAEGAGLNAPVGTVSAADADTSQTLTYAITGGNPGGLFAIDPATGRITVARSGFLDDAAGNVYRLTVTVMDDLAPVRSSSAVVTVLITESGDDGDAASPEPIPGELLEELDPSGEQRPPRTDAREGAGIAPVEPYEMPRIRMVGFRGEALALSEEVPERESGGEMIDLAPPARELEEPLEFEPRVSSNLSEVHRDMEQDVELLFATVHFSVATMLISAGALSWLVRGSSLVSSLMLSLPAWLRFDPLVVLASADGDVAGERDFEEEWQTWLEGSQIQGVFEGDPTSSEL